MIWGYEFSEIVEHLGRLGFSRASAVDGNVLFLRGGRIFTIREPNADGRLPETIVADAFDNAGLPPPPPATRYVD